MDNCNVSALLYQANRFKEYIKEKRILTILAAIIGLVASFITIFVFFSGIQSCPDALKKLWYNSSEDSTSPAKLYRVKLLLPARMSGAKILVDSQPAVVVQQTSTVIIVQVEEKTTGHQFIVRKGEAVCTQLPQLIRENNITIHPCQ